MSGGRWIDGDTQHRKGDVDIAAFKASRRPKSVEPKEMKTANNTKNMAVFDRKRCSGGKV